MEANKQILAAPPPTVHLHNSSLFACLPPSLRPPLPSLALILSPPSFYLSSDMQFLFLRPRLSCFLSKDKKQSRDINSIIYYLHHVITEKKGAMGFFLMMMMNNLLTLLLFLQV